MRRHPGTRSLNTRTQRRREGSEGALLGDMGSREARAPLAVAPRAKCCRSPSVPQGGTGRKTQCLCPFMSHLLLEAPVDNPNQGPECTAEGPGLGVGGGGVMSWGAEQEESWIWEM